MFKVLRDLSDSTEKLAPSKCENTAELLELAGPVALQRMERTYCPKIEQAPKFPNPRVRGGFEACPGVV